MANRIELDADGNATIIADNNHLPGNTLLVEMSLCKYLNIVQKNVVFSQSTVSAVDLETDTAISARTGEEKKNLDGRKLKSVDSSWLGEIDGSLGDMNHKTGEWDQFATNKKLFNVTAKYDENLYTKKLDKSDLTAEQRARAEKIARSIEGAASSNIHVREERNQSALRDDAEMDEEDRYSGVLTASGKQRHDESNNSSWTRGQKPGKDSKKFESNNKDKTENKKKVSNATSEEKPMPMSLEELERMAKPQGGNEGDDDNKKNNKDEDGKTENTESVAAPPGMAPLPPGMSMSDILEEKKGAHKLSAKAAEWTPGGFGGGGMPSPSPTSNINPSVMNPNQPPSPVPGSTGTNMMIQQSPPLQQQQQQQQQQQHPGMGGPNSNPHAPRGPPTGDTPGHLQAQTPHAHMPNPNISLQGPGNIGPGVNVGPNMHGQPQNMMDGMPNMMVPPPGQMDPNMMMQHQRQQQPIPMMSGMGAYQPEFMQPPPHAQHQMNQMQMYNNNMGARPMMMNGLDNRGQIMMQHQQSMNMGAYQHHRGPPAHMHHQQMNMHQMQQMGMIPQMGMQQRGHMPGYGHGYNQHSHGGHMGGGQQRPYYNQNTRGRGRGRGGRGRGRENFTSGGGGAFASGNNNNNNATNTNTNLTTDNASNASSAPVTSDSNNEGSDITPSDSHASTTTATGGSGSQEKSNENSASSDAGPGTSKSKVTDTNNVDTTTSSTDIPQNEVTGVATITSKVEKSDSSTSSSAEDIILGSVSVTPAADASTTGSSDATDDKDDHIKSTTE